MIFRVGTRGSRLSLIQTDMVVEKIKRASPGVEVERKIITTSGDVDRRTPLFALSQKGIFEKEVDQAVVDGKVDFAIHSMKDVPTELNARLAIACVPERGVTADVLVSRHGEKLRELRDGKIVGTSSLLRAAELRRIRPGLKVEPIRGNVDTRVEKIERGEYDATILAEAGLARLGLMDKVAERLSLDDFPPAPGQGTLAVVARRFDSKLLAILEKVEHGPTRAEARAERELVRVLEGGCKVPLGALASANREMVQLTGSIFSIDGKQRLVGKKIGSIDEAVTIGKSVGEELLKKGAKKMEETWRTAYS